jgi:hypothetical protein
MDSEKPLSIFFGGNMGTRINIALDQEEYSALFKTAIKELRNLSDQAHFVLRSDLKRRGLLSDISNQNQSVKEECDVE